MPWHIAHIDHQVPIDAQGHPVVWYGRLFGYSAVRVMGLRAVGVAVRVEGNDIANEDELGWAPLDGWMGMLKWWT